MYPAAPTRPMSILATIILLVGSVDMRLASWRPTPGTRGDGVPSCDT
jgi:hypothetical protein